jgi:hypothetical protein
VYNTTGGEIELAKEAISMCQSAELGIRAFQASIPRIKD